MKKSEKITINGIEYIPVSAVKDKAVSKEGLEYVIIRADRAGVFAGYLKSQKGDGQYKEVNMLECRRLWYWDGASSLSQLAIDGVSKPQNCKFPIEVPDIIVMGIIEIIPCSETARLSIKEVSIWQQ